MANPKMHPESDARKPLTAERLRELLDYDPETGVFLWRASGKGRLASGIAGYFRDGYLSVRVDGLAYQGHLLAWLYEKGEIPPAGYTIDHIDGDRSNNRIANLRLATPSQNGCNRLKASHNTSGFKGVSARRNRWMATIVLGGKQTYLGTFDKPEQAFAAYCEAAKVLHGPFARLK